jgi:hypothetical protein
MVVNMKRLLISIVLCVLGDGNLAWAEDKPREPDGHARVRFFGQAVIGLTFYENKSCYGGDGVTASRTGFGGAFGSKKNVSLGIPETPNVVNLKDRNGFLAKAFYHEYSVNAGEALTILASLHETTGRTTYSCGNIGTSFIPGDGKDYEVAFNYGGATCHLSVMQIDSTEAGVKLLPVELSVANKCSDKDKQLQK